MTMVIDVARHFSIRPSRPEVQRERNAAVAGAKTGRASAKLDKATSPKAAKASAMVKPDDHRGFADMWRSFRASAADLLDGLHEEELARIHALAWRHHHAVKPTGEWSQMLSVLRERREARDAMRPARRWKGPVGRDPRLDGW